MKRSAHARKSSPKRSSAKKSGRPAARKGGYDLGRLGKVVERAPVGFTTNPLGGRLLVPQQMAAPVPASKLRSGMREVKRQIDDTLNDLIETLTGNYEIKEIKLVASFNADGKFLGFGVGGAATMEITIRPCE